MDLVLEPGDLALWSPYLVHGSEGPSDATPRRFYINGYVTREDCDRGEWAFRDGCPGSVWSEARRWCTTKQLYERPDPHYVDDR